MGSDANKKVALDVFDAIGARDTARLDSLLADDLEWWVIGDDGFGGSKNKAELKEAVGILWDIVDGPCTIDMQTITAEDDRVALVGQGEMVTKAGVPYRNTYNFLVTVRDGKVVRAREYFDTKLVARVFGM